MTGFTRRSSTSLGIFFAILLLPTLGAGAEAQGPRYTYLGAGYEWMDAKCAVKPEQDERIEGFNAEASLGIFDFLHLLGQYSNGDADFFNSGTGATKERDFTCYKIGLGFNYGLSDTVDLVARGLFVDAEMDAALTSDTPDEDGYEAEGLVRVMTSEKTEMHVGYAYTDLGDIEDREVRLGVVYNATPVFALRFSGVVFDDDTGFDVGVRLYFGDSVF